MITKIRLVQKQDNKGYPFYCVEGFATEGEWETLTPSMSYWLETTESFFDEYKYKFFPPEIKVLKEYP